MVFFPCQTILRMDRTMAVSDRYFKAYILCILCMVYNNIASYVWYILHTNLFAVTRRYWVLFILVKLCTVKLLFNFSEILGVILAPAWMNLKMLRKKHFRIQRTSCMINLFHKWRLFHGNEDCILFNQNMIISHDNSLDVYCACANDLSRDKTLFTYFILLSYHIFTYLSRFKIFRPSFMSKFAHWLSLIIIQSFKLCSRTKTKVLDQ